MITRKTSIKIDKNIKETFCDEVPKLIVIATQAFLHKTMLTENETTLEEFLKEISKLNDDNFPQNIPIVDVKAFLRLERKGIGMKSTLVATAAFGISVFDDFKQYHKIRDELNDVDN